MQFDSSTLVRQATDLHADTVARWHQEPLNNPYTGLLAVICQQHQYNFQLWHEEDIARSPDVGDTRIAEVKRAIDGFNQKRNDWIEKIDETLIQMITTGGVVADANCRLNTETPGSAFDRLSIMSLRIFHLEEELGREDIDAEHIEKVQQKLARCRVQKADLSQSLVDLLFDIFAGRKQLKVYRQMKLYNDPTLNPELYRKRAS